MKSSPSKQNYNDLSRQRRSRFDSPRTSMISQTNYPIEDNQKPIKPRKSPMKSWLSSLNKIQPQKLALEKGSSILIWIMLTYLNRWRG